MSVEEAPRSLEALGLPKIASGLCFEIFAEIVEDSSKFIKDSLRNLRAENPFLHEHLISQGMIFPYRDAYLEWSLAYYELFSRSAKTEGVTLPSISSTLVSSYTTGNEVGLSDATTEARMTVDEEDDQTVTESEDRAHLLVESFIEGDVGRSLELGIFWDHFIAYSNLRNSYEGNEDAILQLQASIVELARFIYGQADANLLSLEFPEAEELLSKVIAEETSS